MDIPSKLYIQDIVKDELDDDFVGKVISLIDETCSQAYLLRSPLNEKKYNYYYEQDSENPDIYNNGFVFLQPGYPIVFISNDDDEDALHYYGEQFILDVNSLSDKFRYDKYIGRQLRWRKFIDNYFSKNNLDEYSELKQNGDDKRKTELLISLIIGSINQIDSISIKASDNLLDKVKNKIQLFDGDQTRFIWLCCTKI
ncbi:hypothetical protein [Acinetobacter haemolyticus]|uniref:hypothetical protein n=1 Tax=Acinetobacter haemolyticus TaxID=29430 RepID=UPI001D18162E|nr:hypothetical protein [Acinetobacter haemolyticus]